jgi:hypothetical protein
MLEKIKKAFTKKKPAAKKVISNMDDLDNGVGINQEVKSQSKTEVKTETKSSLTFGK